MGDLADITKLAGFEFTEHVKYSDTGKIIALRGLNIKNGVLALADVKYIDNSNFEKLKRSQLFIKDILFTYVGTIGEIALVPESNKYYLAPNVSRIRINKLVNAKFIQVQMYTEQYKTNEILPLITTSSQPALSMENIRKFKVKIPSIFEQKLIGSFFEKIDQTITLHQKKLDKLKKLKEALLEEMFV